MKIHPVFHISKLKIVKCRDSTLIPPSSSTSNDVHRPPPELIRRRWRRRVGSGEDCQSSICETEEQQKENRILSAMEGLS